MTAREAIAKLATAPPNEGLWSRRLREARLLIALRIDRKAPDFMIQAARAHLAAVEQRIRDASATHPAATAESPSFLESMGTSTRFAMFAAMGLFFGVQMASNAMRPVIIQKIEAPAPYKNPNLSLATCCSVSPPDQVTTKSSTSYDSRGNVTKSSYSRSTKPGK
jgi:hypothetical protein